MFTGIKGRAYRHTTAWLVLVSMWVMFLPADAFADSQSSGYKIGAGDVMRLMVWGQETLSGEVIIRENGTLPLPLINDLSIKGMTLSQAEKAVTHRLSDFIKDPKCVLDVVSSRYFKISVFGAITNPGVYPVRGKATIIELVAAAGGPAKRASLSKTRVMRGGHTTRVNLRNIMQKGSLAENITVKPGDIIYIPKNKRPTMRDLGAWMSLVNTFLALVLVSRGI